MVHMFVGIFAVDFCGRGNKHASTPGRSKYPTFEVSASEYHALGKVLLGPAFKEPAKQWPTIPH